MKEGNPSSVIFVLTALDQKRSLDLVHDGQKPFKCDRCDAGFMGKYNLNLHIKVVHEGNKPFKCSVCVDSFTSKRSLEGHFDLVHNGHN